MRSEARGCVSRMLPTRAIRVCSVISAPHWGCVSDVWSGGLRSLLPFLPILCLFVWVSSGHLVVALFISDFISRAYRAYNLLRSLIMSCSGTVGTCCQP